MVTRYWGIDDLNAPVGAHDNEAFEGICMAEFNDHEMLLDEYRWNVAVGKWVRTHLVGEWMFLGNAWLTEIDEARALAWIQAHRPKNELGEVIDGIRLEGIAEHLLALPEGTPWILDFTFGRWIDAPVNDDLVGFCQVLRQGASNWWIEFSSDEFNNPKLTERQKQAILEAGFDEPDDAESPNYWIKLADVSAKRVVNLIEHVLNKGGFAD